MFDFTMEGNAVASSVELTENQGTLMLDATCALSNIRYPQDISLLNEACEKLKTILIRFCQSLWYSSIKDVSPSGKVKAPVEFGVKFDLSIDEDGYGRIDTISFDAYNECTILQGTICICDESL